jgi:nucleotide-binding universal stress UspA family protein
MACSSSAGDSPFTSGGEAIRTTVRLPGDLPDAALRELAASAGYEVIAVGTRGAGLSSGLLGSTAVERARHSKLPVLLVGGSEQGRSDEGS